MTHLGVRLRRLLGAVLLLVSFECFLVLFSVLAVLYEVRRRLVHVDRVDLVLLDLELLLKYLEVLLGSFPLIFDVGTRGGSIYVVWRQAVAIDFAVDEGRAHLLDLTTIDRLFAAILFCVRLIFLARAAFLSSLPRPPRSLLLLSLRSLCASLRDYRFRVEPRLLIKSIGGSLE